MSAQLIEVLVPVPVVSPQGALWAAQAAVWLGRTLGRFGRSVCRAATPEQTVARDAAAVRALAESWRNTDPGFASDLHAAASRHESSFDAAALAAR